MKLHRRGIIFVLLFCIGGLLAIYFFLKPQLISVKKIENDGTVNAVFVGQGKYQNSFAESLKSAEASAAPFRRAGDLMKVGRYDEALKALDESLKNSTRSIERSMVYRARREIYQTTGNLEKELEAIEMWFADVGKKANNPEFENRADEIRQLLANKTGGIVTGPPPAEKG